MKTITDTDAAYIAAMLDGEGWISIQKKTGKRITPSYWSDVGISNTNYEMLIWIWKITGIGRVNPKGKTRTGKSSFFWLVPTEKVEILLKRILPFMKIKEEHALIMLDFLKMKNVENSKQDDLIEQELLCQELRKLNQ